MKFDMDLHRFLALVYLLISAMYVIIYCDERDLLDLALALGALSMSYTLYTRRQLNQLMEKLKENGE